MKKALFLTRVSLYRSRRPRSGRPGLSRSDTWRNGGCMATCRNLFGLIAMLARIKCKKVGGGMTSELGRKKNHKKVQNKKNL